MDTIQKNIFLLTLILLNFQFGLAQNLVPNGDFENYSELPTSEGQWNYCTDWSNVNNMLASSQYASPDYLHTNGSGKVELPNSVFGAVMPYSGSAIMGFSSHQYSTANFREYIESQLLSNLDIGVTYDISFWLTNGMEGNNIGRSCNHIGVQFSVSPLFQRFYEPIGGTPHFEIEGQVWSTIWKKYTFSFTADAAYKYLTIGNFFDDDETEVVIQNPSSNSTLGSAYYFIDKIEVVKQRLTIVGSTEICIGDSTELIALNSSTFSWSNSLSPNSNFSNAPKVIVKPTSTSTYIVEGEGETSRISVNVIHLPLVNIGNDTALCENEQLLLDASGIGASYLWHDNSKSPLYLSSKKGTFWVAVSNMCGTVTDSITILSKEDELKLEMPNVFSPNNDNVNDAFLPISISGFDDVSLSIYSRWGEKLAEISDMDIGWDGNYKNRKCLDGTYYWIIESTHNCGNVPRGFLNLIK